MTKILLYLLAGIVSGIISTYILMTISYYIKQLIEVSNVKKLIEEIQAEYNLEIEKLFSQYEHGVIELEELGEKQEFITNLYVKMFNDLEEKFTLKYNKERIRLR